MTLYTLSLRVIHHKTPQVHHIKQVSNKLRMLYPLLVLQVLQEQVVLMVHQEQVVLMVRQVQVVKMVLQV
jgi:hypothetical protein